MLFWFASVSLVTDVVVATIGDVDVEGVVVAEVEMAFCKAVCSSFCGGILSLGRSSCCK